MNNLKFIDCERIYLRPLFIEDTKGHYIDWLNDEEVCKQNGHHFYPYTITKGETYVASLDHDQSKLVLAIIDKESNRHIGNVSLQNINYISRTAEFAIIIGEKDCWGKGYAFEAAKVVIEHGFKSLNLNRIACGTFSSNIAMQKLAIKLGFEQEGVRKEAFYKDGVYLDIFEYGLLRTKFMK